MVKNKVGIYVILIVIIAVTSIIGTVLLVHNQNKTKGYVKTKGVVVDYKVKIEHEYDDIRGTYEKKMYSEVVEFKVNGVTYRAQNKVWTNSPKARGKEVEVIYNPNNPNECEFVKSQHFGSLVLYLMSGICLLALIAQIVSSVKFKHKHMNNDNDNIMIA